MEIYKLWLAWTEEEKATKAARINQYMDSILKQVTSKKEVFDEQAYTSSISQEIKVRYEGYQARLESVLQEGKGMTDLLGLTYMGLNVRLAKIQSKAIEILTAEDTLNNKACLLAKALTEVVL